MPNGSFFSYNVKSERIQLVSATPSSVEQETMQPLREQLLEHADSDEFLETLIDKYSVRCALVAVTNAALQSRFQN